VQTCFIIMPISMPADSSNLYGGDEDHFRHVLEHLFVPAIEKIGLTAIVPVAVGADVIHAEIIRNLETADIVLCDMSTLNPNVFFELGIRTAVDKPVSLVRDQFTSRIPFDTTLINHHKYDANLAPWTLPEEIRQLSDHLLKTINKSGSRNSLWKYFGLTTRAELPAPSSIEDKLNFIIRSLERSYYSEDGLSRQDSISLREHLAIEREVVKRAQALAAKIEAEFTVLEMAPGRIVLNFGEYVIDEGYKQLIIKLGKEHGVDVSIQGAAESERV
jgi:hypothetical protein